LRTTFSKSYSRFSLGPIGKTLVFYYGIRPKYC
jgi:hypothetical protein